MMRRDERLLKVVRELRNRRAAVVQGRRPPPKEWDRSGEAIGLYGLISEMTGSIGDGQPGVALDIQALGDFVGRLGAVAYDEIVQSGIIEKIMSDSVALLQAGEKSPFKRDRQMASYKTAIEDAATYAAVLSIFDVMLRVLDRVDADRKVVLRDLKDESESRRDRGGAALLSGSAVGSLG